MSSSEWSIRFSNTRKLPYFYNSSSGQSTWELPQGMTEQEAMGLEGAHHLKQQTGQPQQQEGKVRASHLLIKSRESRRPSSWKEVSKKERETEMERERDGGIRKLIISLLPIHHWLSPPIEQYHSF